VYIELISASASALLVVPSLICW